MSAIGIDKAGGWAAWSAYERAHGGPGEAITAWYTTKMNTGAPGHGLKHRADLEAATWKGNFQ
jgi:hypothetical protein